MLIGIVGKPSAGKSTFFKAMTLAEVDIANYPFTTIKPNHGTGFVKVECADKEFNTTCNPRFGYCIHSRRFVPIDLLDVAGLVPGAHEGKGMGNQFLDDLSQGNALVHIIDCSGSTNEKGESVEAGSHDPAKDIVFLEFELDMWFLRLIEKGWDKFARKVNQEHAQAYKAVASHLTGLGVTEDIAKGVIAKLNLPADIMKWDREILKQIATELRKITKPMIIACNKIDIPTAQANFERLKKEFPSHMMVACSAESELALKGAARAGIIDYIPGEKEFTMKDVSKLNEKQKNALEFIRKNILEKYGSTGVQDVLDRAVFNLLGMIAIFPGGVSKLEDSEGRRLPDCFLLPGKTTALDFAFKLHTDLGKNFIKAIDVRTKKAVGKDHPLKHRDVVEIVTGK
ncbi:redox-regulated ATPase YchF [Candidatus Woesearchaeota archaeon]|nr:redox-regulated ATPase YchF [Candidatus Woesearchaeota archaeon]